MLMSSGEELRRRDKLIEFFVHVGAGYLEIRRLSGGIYLEHYFCLIVGDS